MSRPIRSSTLVRKALPFLLLSLPLFAQDASDATAIELRDIRPPVNIFEMPWFWAGIALVLLGAGYLIFRALRRWSGRSAPTAEKAIDPYQRARAGLAEARELIETGSDEQFSATVSSTLRSYIEEATGIRAREQTTEEFLSDVAAKNRLPEAAWSPLSQFLAACDLAKFARQRLARDQRESLHSTAESCVERIHEDVQARAAAAQAEQKQETPTR